MEKLAVMCCTVLHRILEAPSGGYDLLMGPHDTFLPSLKAIRLIVHPLQQ
jgi:hypothetical protein